MLEQFRTYLTHTVRVKPFLIFLFGPVDSLLDLANLFSERHLLRIDCFVLMQGLTIGTPSL